MTFFTQRGSRSTKVTRAASEVGKVLDSKTADARAGRADISHAPPRGKWSSEILPENSS